MGFGVNFNNKPVIQGAQQAQDGGAGNLGYFEQNKDEENEKKESGSIFSKQGSDAFVSSSDSDLDKDDFSISKIIAQVILTVKDFLKKLFKN